jgi:hypothetical protein
LQNLDHLGVPGDSEGILIGKLQNRAKAAHLGKTGNRVADHLIRIIISIENSRIYSAI